MVEAQTAYLDHSPYGRAPHFWLVIGQKLVVLAMHLAIQAETKLLLVGGAFGLASYRRGVRLDL